MTRRRITRERTERFVPAYVYSIVSSSIIGAWNIWGAFWMGQADLRSGGKCIVHVVNTEGSKCTAQTCMHVES